MGQKLVITADGSTSVYAEEFEEHYHSIHGAIQESQHVFIDAGLHHKDNLQEIFILEAGLGTGLNALLSCLETEKNKRRIHYTAIEKFPLSTEMYVQLNYCSLFPGTTCESYFQKIWNASWETETEISPNFTILKLRMDIEEIIFTNRFDIIYFDAFAPASQPELWTEKVFASMYSALKPSGILVTYCAKGSVKRAMKAAGFSIEALPGPKGKREMTRAVK